MTTRKDFLKKSCLAGACFCGFPALANTGLGTSGSHEDSEQQMMQQWMSSLLKNIEGTKDEKLARELLKGCAVSHYNQLNMDEFLKPYEGKLEAFNQLLEKEWGWKVDYQKENRVLLADENKNYCVCPVLKPEGDRKNPALCFCSEGFAELMFSKVVGKPVNAKVISSIHRGNDRCIYKISL